MKVGVSVEALIIFSMFDSFSFFLSISLFLFHMHSKYIANGPVVERHGR